MSELIRSIHWKDLSGYRILLDRCFSQGPGREETRTALLRMARLYSRAFPLIRLLTLLRLLPWSVPRVYVCLRDGRVAGAICIRRKAPGAYYVVHLAVDAEFRRMGIGSRLRAHAVGRLPREEGLRLLARHRRQNEPQVKNAAKFGYQPYLREYTLSLAGDALVRLCDRLGPKGADELGEPVEGEIRELKLRAFPPIALELDPSLGEPHDEGSRIMQLFNLLAVRSRRSEQVLRRKGRVIGACRIFYHRLQNTHEAEFILDDEADSEAISALFGGMARALRTAGAGEIRVRVWDFQPRLRRFLLEQGFRELVERILVYCCLE